MSVTSHPTPNPNALKFSVGVDVGGPKTFAAGAQTEDPVATALLSIDGVTSIFMTADFVTVSKSAEADWELIAPEAERALAEHYHGA